jgi:TetR/AcrR family transcriptional regulator, acrAB operon repressor
VGVAQATGSKAEQSLKTRRRLVSSATELFARKGYRETSVQDIADAAGISRGSIFWHFGSKEGLLWAVAEELFARWELEVLVPEVGETTGIEAVRRSLDAHRTFLTGQTDAHRLFYVLMFEALGPRADLAGEYARLHRHFRTLGAAWIARGVEDGSVRADVDPVAIAVAIVGALGGIAYQYLLDPAGVDLDRIYEALGRTLERGLSK